MKFDHKNISRFIAAAAVSAICFSLSVFSSAAADAPESSESSKLPVIALAAIFAVLSGVGFWLFVKNRIPEYLFFRMHFAFLDYEKPAVLVFAENLAILTAFTFLGSSCASIVKPSKNADDGGKRKKATTAIFVVVAILIGVALTLR